MIGVRRYGWMLLGAVSVILGLALWSFLSWLLFAGGHLRAEAHGSWPAPCGLYMLFQDSSGSGCVLSGDTSGWSTEGPYGGDYSFGQILKTDSDTTAYEVGIIARVSSGTQTNQYRIYAFDVAGVSAGTLMRSGNITFTTSGVWQYATLSSALHLSALDRVVLVVDAPVGYIRYEKACDLGGSGTLYSHHGLSNKTGGVGTYHCAGHGSLGGNTTTPVDNVFGMTLLVEDDTVPTATPTNTPSASPTPTATPTPVPPTATPTATPTPSPVPSPGGTPVGTLGPSGHVWVDNFWEIANPIRELPASIVNAFATLVVPEPTMIAAAQQTAEAATGVNVANAQATAAARWQTTVDVYDTKTNFVTEIGGLLGELRDALVDAPCGDVGITISPTLMGKTITLDFFTEEQLDVWWCPVFRPLLEAALYLLLTVSALMLWMRFRRSGGNE